MRRFAAIIIACAALIAAPKADDAAALKIFGQTTAYFFLPVADLAHDTSLSNFLRAPKLFAKIGAEVNSGEVKFVTHWNAELILRDLNNISNIVSFGVGDNYLSWNPRGSRFAFGYQTYAWGKADGLNPTSVLNPMDFRMPTDLKKLPVLSFAYSAYPFEWLSIDAVALPFKQESMLPYSIREKIPNTVFNKHIATALSLVITNFNMGTGDVGMTTTATTADTVMSNDIRNDQFSFDLHDPVGALRVNLFGPVDVSLMYAYDIDQYYTTAISVERYTALSQPLVDAAVDAAVIDAVARGVVPNVAAVTNALSIQLKAGIPKDTYRIASLGLSRTRVHRFGADMKTTLGPLGVWAELCYSLTEDPGNNAARIRNPYLEWTAGCDFSYGPDDQWYMNIQYTGCYVQNYDDRFYTDYPNGIPDPVQAMNANYMTDYYYRAFTQKFGNQYEGLSHGIAIKANWPILNDRLVPSIALSYFLPMIYDTKEKTRYGRGIVMPELKWNITDAVSASLGANVYLAFKMDAGSSRIAIDRDDPIGMFYDDSTVYCKFTYAWNMIRPLSE